MIYRLLIFLALNFGALALGSFSAGEGPRSEWYAGLATAPWTPSGWVFSTSWTIILIGFSIYLAYLWPTTLNKKLLIGLLILHYILIIIWNPIFFHYRELLAGLVVITTLTLVVGFILIYYWPQLSLKSLYLFPYFIWLVVAVSLNAYVFIKN